MGDTAMHVLKGAIVSVLGAQCAVTTGIDFVSKFKGKLKVQFKDESFSPEQIDEIQLAANRKIQDNVPVRCFKMERKEAEEKYTAAPVNSTFIYDKFPVPESVTTLQLVEIEDWNVNCCTGEHCERTGVLVALVLLKVSHKKAKQELEFFFGVGEVAEKERKRIAEAGRGAKATKMNPNRRKVERKEEESALVFANYEIGKRPPLEATADQLLAVVREEGGSEELANSLKPRFLALLASFQNGAYTRGFQARLDPNQQRLVL